MDSNTLVLVVDDDRNIRNVVADVLLDEGYLVATASNGREAIEKLETVRADVILLDMMMPVLDGRGFIAEYKARFPLAERLPVVALSAVMSKELESELKGIGVPYCYAKPFQIEQILSCVNDVLQDAARQETAETHRDSGPSALR